MRLCTYVVAQGSPDEDPIPSPAPRADGMLMGGICQLVVFPSAGMLSAPLLLPKGLLPPQALGGCIPPAPALPPLCHQLPPKCYFNNQQQPGPCRVPGCELCPSGKRDGTRAGGLEDMGQLCPWPPEGRRDEDLGTRTLLSFFHPRAQLDFLPHFLNPFS